MATETPKVFTERVLMMGVTKEMRVKQNTSGGFTIQQLVPTKFIKDGTITDPEPDLKGPKDEPLAWKSIATTPIYQEACNGLIDMQQELVRDRGHSRPMVK